MNAITANILKSVAMKKVLNDVRTRAAAYAVRNVVAKVPFIRRRLQARGAKFRTRKVYKYVKPFKRKVWNKYARPAMLKYARSGKKEYYRRAAPFNPRRYF